jgi:hypothetical protein
MRLHVGIAILVLYYYTCICLTQLHFRHKPKRGLESWLQLFILWTLLNLYGHMNGKLINQNIRIWCRVEGEVRDIELLPCNLRHFDLCWTNSHYRDIIVVIFPREWPDIPLLLRWVRQTPLSYIPRSDSTLGWKFDNPD